MDLRRKGREQIVFWLRLLSIVSCSSAILASPPELDCSAALEVLKQPSQTMLGAGEDWKLDGVLYPRLSAVIAHQNEMRKRLQIPQLIGPIEVGIETYGPERIYCHIGEANRCDEAGGRFYFHGNQLIRESKNDIFTLNFAYSFAGNRLIQAEPHAAWYLNRSPSEALPLFRKMAATEFDLWTQERFEEPGKVWGHIDPANPTADSPRVLHFSTSKDFTSAAGGQFFIQLDVQRRTLLDLLDRRVLWSGNLVFHDAIELVLRTEDVSHLLRSREVPPPTWWKAKIPAP